jgi:PAS domain S-box-containing protein
LINQGKLIGILYLENNLTPHVFTPDRVTVLKVLASQAAVSLENARLYRDLEDREGKIRRLVDANIVGIVVADLEGRVVEANDAFLRIIGYNREDLTSGRVRWNELTPPEWREDAEIRRTCGELSVRRLVEQQRGGERGDQHQWRAHNAFGTARATWPRTLWILYGAAAATDP